MIKKPLSIFSVPEINSVSDIFELYINYELTQELATFITQESGRFLHFKKNVPMQLLEKEFNMFFSFNFDKTLISVSGKNLLSSLWIIGVYPENPENLVDKMIYEHGDFVYKFYTKNKNLSKKKVKRKNETKPSNHP